MTLCRETANKWACSSKHTAAWCLNRNSTVDGVIITVTFCIITVWAWRIWGRAMATLMNQWANEAAIVLAYWNTLRRIEWVVARRVCARSFLSYHRIEALQKEMQWWGSESHLNLIQVTFRHSWQKRKSTNGFKLEKKIAEKKMKKKNSYTFSSTQVSLTRSGLRMVLGSN